MQVINTGTADYLKIEDFSITEIAKKVQNPIQTNFLTKVSNAI